MNRVRKEAGRAGTILKGSNQLVALGKRVPSEGFSTEGFFGLGTCSCSLFLGFMNEMTWG